MSTSFKCEGVDKDQLVISLAAILLTDSKADITAESLDAVVSASGNSVPAYYSTLYAKYIEKSGGLDKFFAGPGSGGGAAVAAPAAGAPAAAAAPEAPKEEEVDALAGGMDMFGGTEKTGDY
eukprot:CAMPEP_0173183534 /NCGR_PEP_ID=MMETSP1141-20130122/8446_1 /TAXON_ID=483371 /ORGANISM="non described non described, Strain CCMP2298" /LENGTH=121 /DNA_ID=CAMNT_0014106749 /DNA_START=35 /DNA_END=400 /DNA_ORIENTATION=+